MENMYWLGGQEYYSYQREVYLRLLIGHEYHNHKQAEGRAKVGNCVENLPGLDITYCL